MRRALMSTAFALLLLFLLSPPSRAFMQEGCGGGACTDCHSMTRDEAAKLLEGAVDKVLSVEPSPVGGLWVVDIEKEGKRWPVYIDYSKGFLISGQIIRLSSKENVTESRYMKLNPVDVSSISLGNAVVIGDPKAKHRIIEYSDPDCQFCGKLHEEAKKVVAKNRDVAFFVKLYSRTGNPASVEKARSILCGGKNAAKRLSEAFAGRAVPPPDCRTQAPEETAREAGQLGLRGTPVMILPDGRVVNGYRDAETILKLLEEGMPVAKTE